MLRIGVTRSKLLTPSSLRLNNTYDCNPETKETSALLSRFLSTQKLKVFKEISSHGSRRQGHNISGKNSFRITHNESNAVGFPNSTFNTTSRQVKVEPHLITFSTVKFDLESFHVKQEPEEFKTSDPFVTITSHYDANQLEHQEHGFSYPFTITNNHQVKREIHEYDFLDPRFNTDDHQAVTQRYPLLTDFSYDRDTFDVGRNFFERKESSSRPGSNPVKWDSDPPLITSWMPAYFMSEETAAIKLDRFCLPLDGFKDEEQPAAAAFSLLDDSPPRRMKNSRNNFENGASDWDDALTRKKCTYSDERDCGPSEAWDTPRRQEINDPVYSGGNSGYMCNHDDGNSWSQTVSGGKAEYVSDYLTGDIDV